MNPWLPGALLPCVRPGCLGIPGIFGTKKKRKRRNRGKRGPYTPLPPKKRKVMGSHVLFMENGTCGKKKRSPMDGYWIWRGCRFLFRYFWYFRCRLGKAAWPRKPASRLVDETSQVRKVNSYRPSTGLHSRVWGDIIIRVRRREVVL